MMNLSKKALSIQPSPTLAITAKANQMKADGKDVVGFGAGEPDMDTPAYIKEAAIAAINAGFTKYTPSSGIMDLRKAIAEKLAKENGVQVEPSQIVVSNGAKHSIANVCQALLNEGDEVIIPAPYWVSYPEIVKMYGGKPVIVDTLEEDGFLLKAQRLEKVINEKTKLFILCSPSNPTGSMYDAAQLAELAEVLSKRDIYTLSDEIYEKLIYDGAKHISIASLPGMADRTITINGMSKAYSMTGWRIGYAAGPKDLMKAVDNIQSHGASNPVSISQKAALAALKGDGVQLEAMRVEFQKRRDVMVQKLNAIPGVTCLKPQGAFYCFPNVSAHFGKSRPGGAPIQDSTAFASQLLEAEGVAVVPGADFGASDFMRLSYATDLASIEKGLERIARFCASLA